MAQRDARCPQAAHGGAAMVANPERKAKQNPDDGGSFDRSHAVTAVAVKRKSEQPRREHDQLFQRILKVTEIYPQSLGLIPDEGVEGGRLQSLMGNGIDACRETEQHREVPAFECENQPFGGRIHLWNRRREPASLTTAPLRQRRRHR